MDQELKFILYEMREKFCSNRLKVILIPDPDPPNIGACLRVASNSNTEWYREMCLDFPSCRKKQYRKFKTAVKRKSIERILNRLIEGKKSTSKYAQWILSYADSRLSDLNIDNVPF